MKALGIFGTCLVPIGSDHIFERLPETLIDLSCFTSLSEVVSSPQGLEVGDVVHQMKLFFFEIRYGSDVIVVPSMLVSSCFVLLQI